MSLLNKNNSILFVDCENVEKEVKAKKEKLNEEADDKDKQDEITTSIDEIYRNIKQKLSINDKVNAII